MYLISKNKPESISYTNISANLYKIFFRTDIVENTNSYSYNEYTIVQEITDEDILEYINTNYDNLLAFAKSEDNQLQNENKINSLKIQLSNTDYKVIKNLENYTLGLTLPYDYSSLITSRQEIRDTINNLESGEATEEDELTQTKTRKINEMCSIAQTTITNGIDYNEAHYRLNTTDQINLTSLYSMAQSGAVTPYHADGEVCRIYQPEEMIALVKTALNWITYHTTYFNLIKHQINDLTTIEEVNAVTYGMELKEEYQAILDAIVNNG